MRFPVNKSTSLLGVAAVAAAMSLAGPNEQGDLSSNQEEQQPVPRSRAQRRAAKRATRKKGNIRQK